jgi:hypothetical protein
MNIHHHLNGLDRSGYFSLSVFFTAGHINNKDRSGTH